jgi:small-conductance mechanosensitive channel
LRIKTRFGFHYHNDIERATEIIIEEAGDLPDVLDDPTPSVRVTHHAHSSVGLQARVLIFRPKRTDFVRIRSEYVRNVENRFDEADITSPFPQRPLSESLAMTD